ncbi:Zn(II)2Cys6 transcription factor domain-containing protein [Aspergillus homomorphus CBS 101889]|uniref:Zn(2)-C6 fungal-type domain-containing protein n=1 Tax=Aspergillus homomorphus (strain CBS 101889) TaxID=1450537 RepID=A0A395IB38_ASPHC|nr:hypothetical protein BO97DRAFT_358961 [Aspergillus homomorphus CBS 101889]RAL17266.1 hypothetical protein BO97DRAFT_358961 [Aspergillus homomorphus CBS 101889]
MGGSPYQSQGCITCRQRRVENQCDLAKPECARCVKRGTLCLGYETNRHFLHHTLITRIDDSGASSKRPVTQRLGQLRPLALPATLNLGAEVRTQLFSTFMTTFFASDDNVNDLNARDDSWYFMMARFPSLTGESALLDRSVMAFVCTFLGRKANDSPLARHGIELYSNALRLMAGWLKQKATSTPHLLLYATIVFHTYETMQTGDAALQNSFAHIRGATAILNHPSFQHAPDQPLTQTMITRQKWAAAFCITTTPSVLDNMEWGCSTQDQNEGPMDAMFALIAETARLQRSLDTSSRQPHSECQAAARVLLRRCFDLAKRLRTYWPDDQGDRRHPEDHLPSLCDPITLRHEHNEPQTSPLPDDPFNLPPYDFADLGTAKIYLLYWIVAMTIRRLIYHTETLLLKGDNGATAPPVVLRVPTREIYRTVAYHLQPRNLMSSTHAVLFAVSVLSKCCLDCRDETGFRWCQGIYRLLQARGLDVASRLGEADRRQWAGMHSSMTELALPVSV